MAASRQLAGMYVKYIMASTVHIRYAGTYVQRCRLSRNPRQITLPPNLTSRMSAYV